ncbi:hypothetical protein GCM10023347_25850 [Streptomyces chumphonensis]|uniref:Uncharacterized protein n=1 Tax=Streptomyces chumphonensis TaxID=1214925 RepID=A0A927F0F3_9ACTN|nr:hypothetical protein [Streptomyces chumphonensis]MBD3932397.1 hypothetical protein [Streptomyces chumphonensis]
MRTIRTAVVSVVMAAGLGTVGTASAFAYGGGIGVDQDNAAACTQDVKKIHTSLLGDVNLGLGLGLLGLGGGQAGSDETVDYRCLVEQKNKSAFN